MQQNLVAETQSTLGLRDAKTYALNCSAYTAVGWLPRRVVVVHKVSGTA